MIVISSEAEVSRGRGLPKSKVQRKREESCYSSGMRSNWRQSSTLTSSAFTILQERTLPSARSE